MSGKVRMARLAISDGLAETTAASKATHTTRTTATATATVTPTPTPTPNNHASMAELAM